MEPCCERSRRVPLRRAFPAVRSLRCTHFAPHAFDAICHALKIFFWGKLSNQYNNRRVVACLSDLQPAPALPLRRLLAAHTGSQRNSHMLWALGLVLTVFASVGAIWVIGQAFDETD